MDEVTLSVKGLDCEDEASLIGGWLWDHVSPSATFYFGAITASLSAILFIVFITMVRRSE